MAKKNFNYSIIYLNIFPPTCTYNNYKILMKSKHIPTDLGGSQHYHQVNFNLQTKKPLFQIDFFINWCFFDDSGGYH
jgi:hypothetical protein